MSGCRAGLLFWLAVASCTASPGTPDAGPDAAPASTCDDGGRGSAWAGWPMPDPAAGRATSQSYDTTTPGVVVDRVTGLAWQRTVPPDSLDWRQATAFCACLVLGGQHDWRLPSRIELISLVDFTRQDPALDSAAFPDTPFEWFWTSSRLADSDPPAAWYVAFFDGNTHHADLEVTYRFRCVRGGTSAQPRHNAGADGTVADAATGLTWQRAVDGEKRTWSEARSYCADLELAGAGWRLPDMKELQTLIDESRVEPAIDGALFPDTPGEGFWAGTPLADTPSSAWFVSFASGIAYNSLVDHPQNVRCVR